MGNVSSEAGQGFQGRDDEEYSESHNDEDEEEERDFE